MKKLKVLLLSFTIVAVVGAALAFKAKDTNSYCTAPTDPGATPCPTTKSCPNLITNQKICTSGTFVCTANPGVDGSCSGINCVASAQLCANILEY